MVKLKKPAMPDDMRTYLLQLVNGGIRKVTVPATWKLTFGPIAPGVERVGGRMQWALRFYEGNKDNLRAVFCDVTGFREEGIPILERRTSVQRKVVQKKTAEGAKDVVVEAKISEWSNPDAVDDDGEVNPFLLQLKKADDELF